MIVKQVLLDPVNEILQVPQTKERRQ